VVDECEATGVGEAAHGVGQEAVAVDGVAVHRAGRWCDDDHHAVWSEHATHLGERAPELLVVLEGLAGHHDVERPVVEGQHVGIVEHDIDPGAGLDVDADVVGVQRRHRRPIVAGGELGGAHLEHPQRAPAAQDGVGKDVLLEAHPHVVERRKVHARISRSVSAALRPSRSAARE
jgi:hypothetical protein